MLRVVWSAIGMMAAEISSCRSAADSFGLSITSFAIRWLSNKIFIRVPYTTEALDLVCANIARAQDAMGRAMLIENPSTYIDFAQADMTEWEFIERVRARTGCGLLLDVNNVFVSGASLCSPTPAITQNSPDESPLLRLCDRAISMHDRAHPLRSEEHGISPGPAAPSPPARYCAAGRRSSSGRPRPAPA